MKKIVPSTRCDAEITVRMIGRISRSMHRDTKFGYIRDLINVAIVAHDSTADPIQSIDVHIAIGA